MSNANRSLRALRAVLFSSFVLFAATRVSAQAPAPTPPETPAPTPVTASIPPPPAPPPAAPPTDEDGPVVSAGLGRGVTVRTADGRFSLTTRLRAQIRATYLSETVGVSEADQDPAAISAEVRRLRLLFQGNFFGPDWQYYVQLGFSRGDTETDLRLPLRDAYVTWSHVRDLNIRFGQGKVPFNRQRVISSSALNMVDRSVANAEFNLDRDVGIQLLSTDLGGLDKRLAYNVGIFSGDGRNRIGTNAGLLYVARFQYAPFGGFDDMVEGDVMRERRLRMAIEVAGAYNMQTLRYRSTWDGTYLFGPYDYVHATGDVVLKYAGWSFSAEAIYRGVVGTQSRTQTVDGADVTERSRAGWGYNVQTGYFFDEHLEAVARYSHVFPIGDDTGVREIGELGGGLNWYFHRHDFKIQADYLWLFEDRFDVGRHMARVQAQFYL